VMKTEAIRAVTSELGEESRRRVGVVMAYMEEERIRQMGPTVVRGRLELRKKASPRQLPKNDKRTCDKKTRKSWFVIFFLVKEGQREESTRSLKGVAEDRIPSERITTKKG